MMTRICTSVLTMMAGVTAAGMAMAADGAGKPVPGGHHFQRPVTEVARDIAWLDDMMHMFMVIPISLLVIALLAICVFMYNRKSNPEPATFTHNTTVEVIWTAVPVLILIAIAIPSVKLLFLQLEVPPKPDVTIKVTGNKWYWSYEYPDQNVSFDASMLGYGKSEMDDEIRTELAEAGYNEDEWLLATDERVVVPVDANVHVLVTASDVIHAWTIPSFGSKIDAMPGRTNETWFKAEEIGTYFGQCSELCGKDHSYMPIVVEVVSQQDYDAWVSEMASRDDEPGTRFARVAE